LLVASSATLAAGAPLVLAACGTTEEDDETSPEREAEVLNEVLAAQLAVLAAIGDAGNAAPGQAAAILGPLETQGSRSAEAIGAYVSELGGTPTEEPAEAIGGESPVEGLARQLEDSIATSTEAIAEVTTAAYRQAVHRATVTNAAALAVMRDTLGEEPAPDAFVMGPPAPGEASE